MAQYINPIIPGERRYPTITPFTYRDGLTYLKTLELLLKAMKELIDKVNDNSEELTDLVVEILNEKIEEINTALSDQETSVDDKIEALETWVNSEVTTIEQYVNGEVTDLRNYVNTKVDEILNASVEIQDPIVAQMVQDDTSDTRTALDSIYKTKNDATTDHQNLETQITNVDTKTDVNTLNINTLDAKVDGVEDIVNQHETELSGRLSNETLKNTYRSKDVYNVLEYGAIGDGVTDDTAAIQTAANECETSGGTLLFPEGHTYFMNGYVEIFSNTRIVGYGATIKKPAAYSSAACFAVKSHQNTYYGGGGENIVIEGFTLVGAANESRTATLLSAHHVDNIHVKNCVGILCIARGHFLDLAACRHVLVDNCILKGAAQADFPGEAIQPDVSKLNSMTVAENNDNWYSGLPALNVTVQNSKFLKYTYGGIEYQAPVPFGVHTSPSSEGVYENMSFINNVCEETQDRDEGIRGMVHFISTRNILIQGNTFDCGTKTAPAIRIHAGYSDNDTHEDQSFNIRITDNTFRRGAGRQVELARGINSIVANNTFDEYGAGGLPASYVPVEAKGFTYASNVCKPAAGVDPSVNSFYFNYSAELEGSSVGNVFHTLNQGGAGATEGRVNSYGNIVITP